MAPAQAGATPNAAPIYGLSCANGSEKSRSAILGHFVVRARSPLWTADVGLRIMTGSLPSFHFRY